jgi:hypothetical protein
LLFTLEGELCHGYLYTTKTFNGDQDALNRSTREQLPNQNAIAIGIDTIHRNLSIEAGTNVRLSDSQASDALSAFQNNYHGGDYTGATIAALDSILGTYNSQNTSNLPGDTITVVTLGIFLGIIGIVVVGLVVVANGKGGGSDGGSHYSGGSYGGGGGGSSGGGAGGHF